MQQFTILKIIGTAWLLKCYREEKDRITSTLGVLGLFCFNLDPPPGTVLKISPINGIATSLKQLFVCFFPM